MDRIDRLGWAAGIAFEAFGLRFGLRVNDPSVLESLLSRVPPCWTDLGSATVDRMYSVLAPTAPRRNLRHFGVLYGDHTRLIRTERLEDLLEFFESDLDLHIAANSQDRLFIHAGAVRWRDHTVLIAGGSRTGKTTLVTEFLKSGAAYYSDDFATIDHSGYVHSYPRNLSVRTQDNTCKKFRPEEFGAARAEPAPISMILLTEYAKDARWEPLPISHGQGILRLLQNTPSARKQPAFALAVLRNAVPSAEVHRGYRGDKAETVQRLLNYLDRRSLS
jgi:hypothetical protein